MKSLGVQHIAEFIECDFIHLDSPEIVEGILREAIENSGLNHVKIISHKFSPVGVTVLAIISESHVGIHTYPESNHISLDIFTCSDSVKQLKLIEILRENFLPKTVKIIEVQRGNPIEINDKNRLTSVSPYGFEVKYLVDEIIYSGKSDYQEIEIIRNPVFGKMLFIDKDLQLAESDYPIYNDALLSHVKQDIKGKEVLILGGGDGTLLHNILQKKPANVTLVDIDKKVLEISDKFLHSLNNHALSDNSVEIINIDALNYLNESHYADIIFYDLTMHPEAFTRKSRKEYIAMLFNKIYTVLPVGGELSMQCGSVYDTASFELAQELLNNYFGDFSTNQVFIPSFCESWIFSAARKK